MNNKRYALMVQYKSALDNAWKKKDRLDLYDSNYEKTLAEVKLSGFKVYRNSDGEHKLVDKCADDEVATIHELFGECFRRNNM